MGPVSQEYYRFYIIYLNSNLHDENVLRTKSKKVRYMDNVLFIVVFPVLTWCVLKTLYCIHIIRKLCLLLVAAIVPKDIHCVSIPLSLMQKEVIQYLCIFSIYYLFAQMNQWWDSLTYLTFYIRNGCCTEAQLNKMVRWVKVVSKLSI